jgi:hypothetical protein
MTRPNYKLIKFVRDLHDINSDWCSDFIHQDAQKRCRRWMDAVLPPTTDDRDLPAELMKAAE